MKLTKQSTLGNTALAGNITYRMVAVYGGTILLGIVLFLSPVFRWNWLAMIAYVALAAIVVGETPTQRSVVKNMYGVLFKKPTQSVVTNLTARTTMGNGVRDVIQQPDYDAVGFKLGTGYMALVYNVTSSITNWSTDEDYERQLSAVKNLFNVFEAGEMLIVCTKEDSDTGMLGLESYLEEHDVIKDDFYRKMSETRRYYLHQAGTSQISRSIQQYGVN